MEKYLKIGRTGKSFGTEGALKFKVEEPFLDDFFEAQVIFIELLGKPVPFFVDHIHNEAPLIVKLEEVDSRKTALELAGKALFLRAEDVSETSLEKPLDLSALEGYRIVDQTLGAIGPIEEVLEFPQQIMAVLQYEGREVLIPLNSQFILEVNAEDQRIEMDLPEGLLEL
ncbi:MAG: 16S rRNA processing protein RimM [Phaeodactylibacter sp.]|nr:16S rRNA processing protein RimM [Phaeodactylibacter sp.]